MRFTELTQEQKVVSRVLAKEDFYFYTRYMFLARRNFKWLQNWHHAKICDALNRVYKGECKRLIINIPPRYSKTEIAVVSWMSWCLGNNPHASFIHTSYSAMLALKNSAESRDVVKHEEFGHIFPNVFVSSTTDAKNEWKTTDGGGVYAVGAGGSITGFGAGGFGSGFNGAIIIDDPHKADEASSDTMRQGVIDWFQNTLESRTNSPDTPIIVIMQRLHESDLAGWLQEGGNNEEWEVLSIPVLDENDTPLWPAKHSYERLMQMKASNSYVFGGQYMQRPSAIGGQHIKGSWFKRYKELPPRIKRVFFSADTAQKAKQHNDYTVFGVWAEGHDGCLYLVEVVRGKWEAPELEAKARDLWGKYADKNPTTMAIEDKASGSSLIQYIQRNKYFPVTPVQVDADKFTRLLGVQGYLESGFVYLPADAAWVADFIEECEKFTANDSHKHDDQVDMLVMGIRHAKGEVSVWDVM